MTVKVGDKIKYPTSGVTVSVTGVDNKVVHLSDGNWCVLSHAEEHKVQTEPEHFETGSIVRFKQTRYRVDGWDGDHHDLTPVDDDDAENLYFSPDMFELVRPPFPAIQSVWQHKTNRIRALVAGADSSLNSVELIHANGTYLTVSVESLYEYYDKLM